MNAFLNPANTCPDVSTELTILFQNFQNGPSAGILAAEGTTLKIICESGYRWTDGSETKLINCSFQGNWSALPSPCTGTLLFTRMSTSKNLL